MSKTLNDTGHKSFHLYIRGLLDKIGKTKTDILYRSNFNIRDSVKQLQHKYITIWREIMENSEKLSFYRGIKSNYETENYLISVKNISFRKELTKLRISKTGRDCMFPFSEIVRKQPIFVFPSHFHFAETYFVVNLARFRHISAPERQCYVSAS